VKPWGLTFLFGFSVTVEERFETGAEVVEDAAVAVVGASVVEVDPLATHSWRPF
jgi:hypothetical protein